jgi:transcriptional regulator with XRE-family HTH domain
VSSAADAFLKKLGQRIRHLRLARGWTQEDLAYAAKIERAYISDIEQGRHNFGVTYLPRLAKALKVSVTAFFDAE